MFANNRAAADAHTRRRATVKLKILRITTHDSVRMHDDTLTERRIPTDDRSRLNFAAIAKDNAFFDNRTGVNGNTHKNQGFVRRVAVGRSDNKSSCASFNKS